MALSKENVSQLISLQHQDAALDTLKAEIDKIPLEIADIRAAVERDKAALTAAKTNILNLEKKKKEKELELAQKEEAARKHGTDLNSVKTNEAFKALQNEIELAKRQANDIETEILEIMESLDASRRDEKKAAADFKKIEDSSKVEIAAFEAKLKDLQVRYDMGKSVRDAAEGPVPADALKVYNHIRGRGKKNAVVPVEGDLCSACRITLAPQVIVEATKAKALVTCESCQRILYKPEKPAAVEAAKVQI